MLIDGVTDTFRGCLIFFRCWHRLQSVAASCKVPRVLEYARQNPHKEVWSIYHCCRSPASSAFL